MNIENVEFDHFKNIEELIQHLEMWYAEDDYFAFDRYFGLRDARIMGMYIYQLQQENQKLKEKINGVYEERDYLYNKTTTESKYIIQQLKDNWNKLKKYAEENLYFYSGYQGEDREEDTSIKDILDKMQELEGDKE